MSEATQEPSTQQAVDNFSLEFETYEFTLTEKDKTVTAYIMTELSGRERDRYMTSMANNMDMKGPTPRLKSFEGLQANLLTLCVRYNSGPKTGQLVSMQDAQNWPSRVQKQLHDRAQKMNGLEADETDKPGTEGNV